MNQVVRINATDRRITYDGEWTRENNTISAFALNSRFFFLFRGSIYAYWISIFRIIS